MLKHNFHRSGSFSYELLTLIKLDVSLFPKWSYKYFTNICTMLLVLKLRALFISRHSSCLETPLVLAGTSSPDTELQYLQFINI